MTTAKEYRILAISKTTVMTTNGNVFDADEESQNRMTRAIVSMQLAEVNETNWILANNTSATVTVAELGEALRLAGQEQTRIWTTYR